MKLLGSLLLLFSFVVWSYAQSSDMTATVAIGDVEPSAIGTAGTSFSTDIGSVLVVTASDDGSSLRLDVSPALFQELLESNGKAPRGAQMGNVSELEELLDSGYKNAVSKRLVITAPAVAAGLSIAKYIAVAAVFFAQLSSFRSDLYPSEVPAMEIRLSPHDTKEIGALPPNVSTMKITNSNGTLIAVVPVEPNDLLPPTGPPYSTATYSTATSATTISATASKPCKIDTVATPIICCEIGCETTLGAPMTGFTALCPTDAPRTDWRLCPCTGCFSSLAGFAGDASSIEAGASIFQSFALGNLAAMTAIPPIPSSFLDASIAPESKTATQAPSPASTGPAVGVVVCATATSANYVAPLVQKPNIASFCKDGYDLYAQHSQVPPKYTASSPYNSGTPEEATIRAVWDKATPNGEVFDDSTRSDCLGYLDKILSQCKVSSDNDIFSYGGSVYANGITWSIEPEYLRQPAVAAPKAICRAQYTSGYTKIEVHGAGFGDEDGGKAVKRALNLFPNFPFKWHFEYTSSGSSDPKGMEWVAYGHWVIQTTHNSRQDLIRLVRKAGGPADCTIGNKPWPWPNTPG